MLLLVGKLGVAEAFDVDLCFCGRREGAPGIPRLEDGVGVSNPGRTGVSCQRVAAAELHLREPRLGALHELLVGEVVGAGHVPCGQPSALAALAQAVRSLVAEGAVQGIALGEVIVQLSVVGQGVGQRIGLAEVLCVLLVHLLEPEVRSVGDAAVVELIAPTCPVGGGAADGRVFCSDHTVDRMLVSEHIIILCHQAEVVGTHVVVVLILDAAGGQNGLGQSEFVVGVGVEQGVGVADG